MLLIFFNKFAPFMVTLNGNEYFRQLLGEALSSVSNSRNSLFSFSAHTSNIPPCIWILQTCSLYSKFFEPSIQYNRKIIILLAECHIFIQMFDLRISGLSSLNNIWLIYNVFPLTIFLTDYWYHFWEFLANDIFFFKSWVLPRCTPRHFSVNE